MKKFYTTKKIVIMAVFISVGIVLQYAESRILISQLPAGKLGLANVVSIINIYMFGGHNALLIATLRATLTSLLTSGAAALPYSVAGAFFSTIAMWIIKKYFYPAVSIIGISIVGAATHNVVQLLVAFLQYGSIFVFSYLPGLLVISLFSGFVTGYTAKTFAQRVLKER